MVEVIRGALFMVTNDTGPMHIAAAVGTPLIPLFGPTTGARTGPYGQIENVLQSKIPCVPCMKPECHNANRLECLKGLTPAIVIRELERRFAQGVERG